MTLLAAAFFLICGAAFLTRPLTLVGDVTRKYLHRGSCRPTLSPDYLNDGNYLAADSGNSDPSHGCCWPTDWMKERHLFRPAATSARSTPITSLTAKL